MIPLDLSGDLEGLITAVFDFGSNFVEGVEEIVGFGANFVSSAAGGIYDIAINTLKFFGFTFNIVSFFIKNPIFLIMIILTFSLLMALRAKDIIDWWRILGQTFAGQIKFVFGILSIIARFSLDFLRWLREMVPFV